MVYKVLLADDSATIQKLVEMALSDSDFQLLAVSDGQQAIDQLDTFNPDIILADAVMPKLDGFQVCEHVRASANHATTPLIMLTGRFQPFDEARAKAVGVNDKVVKPFSKEQLVSVMTERVEASGKKSQEGELSLAESEDGALSMSEEVPEAAPQAAAEEPEPAPAPAEEIPTLDLEEDEPIEEAPTSDFDESATVAISPENLRAHLQSLDNLTTTQDEEMPTIDDFAMEEDDIDLDDDEPVAVTADSFTDANAPAAPVVPEPEPEEPEMEAALEEPAMEMADEEPMELHTEDLDDLELDEEDAITLDDDEPVMADMGDDSIEDLHLEDSADDLEPVEMEELPLEEEDDIVSSGDISAFDEDTEPIPRSEDAVNLDELNFDESGDDLPEDLDLTDDTLEEDELELDDDLAAVEDDAVSLSPDDDTQPVDIEELGVEAPDFGADEPLEDADLELELEDDGDFEIAADEGEDVLGISEEEPASDFDEMADDAATIAMEQPIVAPEPEPEPEPVAAEPDINFDEADTVRASEPIVVPEEATAPEPTPEPAPEPVAQLEEEPAPAEPELLLDDEDDSALADEVVAEPTPEPEPEPVLMSEQPEELILDEGEPNEEIRVDEPVLEPEEEAYFADTVKADKPLADMVDDASTEPAPEPEPAPEMAPEPAPAQAAAEPAPAAPAPVAQSGPVQLDDEQMNQLADMVANRLVERLGSDEIRDIVWQVVPELAEAMIKKRIYQLEQSVDAE